jgi:hypothetical protein
VAYSVEKLEISEASIFADYQSVGESKTFLTPDCAKCFIASFRLLLMPLVLKNIWFAREAKSFSTESGCHLNRSIELAPGLRWVHRSSDVAVSLDVGAWLTPGCQADKIFENAPRGFADGGPNLYPFMRAYPSNYIGFNLLKKSALTLIVTGR